MFGNNKPRIGQELLDVPMGDMIRQMAFAIAEAQIVLDQNSIDVAEMMGGLRTVTDETGEVTFEDSRVYFGTEKISKAAAVELHNSTTNIQQKAEIRAKLNGSITPVRAATFDPAGAATQLDGGKYADHGGSIYVKAPAGSGSAFTQISYRDFTISLDEDANGSTLVDLPRRISMLECGFTPTFYQFVDTIIEVKISIKYTQEGNQNSGSSFSNGSTPTRIGLGLFRLRLGRNIQTSQVNASYSQKYSYSAEGSSLLRTKLVPVPPPPVLNERIQRMLEEEYDNAAVPAETTA